MSMMELRQIENNIYKVSAFSIMFIKLSFNCNSFRLIYVNLCYFMIINVSDLDLEA